MSTVTTRDGTKIYHKYWGRRQQTTSSRTAQREGVVRATASNRFALSKGFVLALALIAGVSAAPRPVAADDVVIAFIRDLGSQALEMIRRPDVPLSGKTAYFGELVRQDFDLTGICRFVLGPYWRTAAPAEQQEFSRLFTERLIDFYGRRLAQSGDGDFVVTGSRTSADGVIVSSRIVPQLGAPIALDWRLGVSEGHYKIADVYVDGVSMALSQRSEIAELLAREGGQLTELLATLRKES
jgi:phospholipid transport system substrate-binding protein